MPGSSNSSSSVSTAAGSTSNNSSNSKCNVDGIMRDLLSSFSSFTSSATYKTYDSVCKKGSCSIKWSTMFLPTSFNSNNSNATESTNEGGGWWPLMDYFKSMNLSYPLQLVTTGSSSGSGGGDLSTGNTTMVSIPSYSLDIYERLGNYSTQLLNENQIMASVTKSMEACLSSFVKDTLQITAVGIFFGAVVGAAVATGVLVGIMTASAALASSDHVPWIMTKLTRFGQKVVVPKITASQPTSKENVVTASEKDSPSSETSTSSTSSTSTSTSILVAHGPLVILQGNPLKSSSSSAEEQCQECLHAMDENLQTNGMTWHDIGRLTVYLVSGKCHASTFRQALQHHLDNHVSSTQQQQHPLLTVVYVHQLEDEHAMLQLEAMACKGGR